MTGNRDVLIVSVSEKKQVVRICNGARMIMTNDFERGFETSELHGAQHGLSACRNEEDLRKGISV